ncbi:MAG: antitoxin Xre-like helix-turn-helix domain-containing protein [Pseudomonas asiatica]
MNTPQSLVLSRDQAAVALKVAVRILQGWQATSSQVCSILRISDTTYRRVTKAPGSGRRLDADQRHRVSLVLNIHAALRNIFTNQENVRNFARLANENAFFAGRSPLDVMAQGDLISLYETCRRVQQLNQSIES